MDRWACGALLPDDLAWSEGKTAASIVYVRTAEQIISRLQQHVAQVKKGDVVKIEFLDDDKVEEFMHMMINALNKPDAV